MKCFISFNTEESMVLGERVRSILQRNNVKPIDMYDISTNENIVNLLEDKIRDSDVFLAIISGHSPQVFYEMGIAKGLKKPIFIVISKDISVFPNFIYDFLYVRANPNDEDNIEFAFKQFIKNQSKQKRKSNRTKQNLNKPSINLPKSWVQNISEFRNNGTARDLENYMINIMGSLNATSKYVDHQGTGVDFALWLDEEQTDIGNQILIEIKYGNINNETLRLGERQLQNYLINTNSKAGLLLYLDRNGKRFPLGTCINPLVVRMDLEDFLSEIEKKKRLLNIILSCRNSMVHGGGK